MAKLDKVFDVDRGQINLNDYYEFKEKPDDEFKNIVIERANENLSALPKANWSGDGLGCARSGLIVFLS